MRRSNTAVIIPFILLVTKAITAVLFRIVLLRTSVFIGSDASLKDHI